MSAPTTLSDEVERQARRSNIDLRQVTSKIDAYSASILRRRREPRRWTVALPGQRGLP